MEFTPFPKLHRLSRDIVVTEKLDGTNAQIFIPDEEQSKTFARKVMAGSRTRWIEPGDDNFGFAAWVEQNWEELLQLGPGHHYGEWWGRGIQRNYGLEERRFSLFNVGRWKTVCSDADGYESAPACCGVVPVLYEGPFETDAVDEVLKKLHDEGSVAAPGFMQPEGVVVFHTHSRQSFKKTLDKNDKHKWEV